MGIEPLLYGLLSIHHLIHKPIRQISNNASVEVAELGSVKFIWYSVCDHRSRNFLLRLVTSEGDVAIISKVDYARAYDGSSRCTKEHFQNFEFRNEQLAA
jgi:hypothetical protein